MPIKDLSKIHFCELCKKKFHPFKGRPGLFCSGICQKKGHKRRVLKTITFNCQCCNKETIQPIHWKSPHKFCSIQCMANIRGQNMSGKNHPRWNGGSNRTGSTTICNRIKKRIGKCKNCGCKDNLQIHHKIKVSERPDLAADENNIEILCVKCHAKEHPEYEGMLLRKKNRFSILCKWCEKEFFVIKSKIGQKYCGLQCSIKNAKQKYMEKYEEKRHEKRIT